ncbi:MAG: hypothetical protein IT290_05445 [Deltaproteobacteria bacterium]|nr:hypothetical protein [Deltaproteobacteria bacterium]
MRWSLPLLVITMLSACSSANPERWDKREKGAAIGGLGGAGVWALVGSQSGNAGAGALIGGAVGAGSGALIGNELEDRDRDDRRYRR